jgi:hypothetical protein
MKQSYTFQNELSSHDINKFNIILIICSIAYDCCGIRNMLMHISEKRVKVAQIEKCKSCLKKENKTKHMKLSGL